MTVPPFFRARIPRCLIAAALACTPFAAEAQRPTAAEYALSRTDSVHVKRVLKSLQSAIARNDSIAVSGHFQYRSLGVWDGHGLVYLQSSRQLLPIYGAVFTSDIRQLILGATLDSLVATMQGVTIGRGRIWFQIDRHGDPRIASIAPAMRGDTTEGLP